MGGAPPIFAGKSTGNEVGCRANSLLINPDKVKLLLVGVRKLTRALSLPSVYLLGKLIYPSRSVVKDLGGWINSNFPYDNDEPILSCLQAASTN